MTEGDTLVLFCVVFLSILCLSLLAELQCSYCPAGFMSAYSLLVHAQITHKLKIFLEKASRGLVDQTRHQVSVIDCVDHFLPIQPSPPFTNISQRDNSNQNLDINNRQKYQRDSGQKAAMSDTAVSSLTDTVQDFDSMGSNILVTSDICNGKRIISDRQCYTPTMSPTAEVDAVISDGSSLTSAQNHCNAYLSPVSVPAGKTADGKVVVLKSGMTKEITKPTTAVKTISSTSQNSTLSQKAFIVKNIPVSVGSLHGTDINNTVGPKVLTAMNIGNISVIPNKLPAQTLSDVQTGSQVHPLAGRRVIDTQKQFVLLKGNKPITTSQSIDAGKLNNLQDQSQNEENEGSEESEMMEQEPVPSSAASCCSDQGCGVTVIPGSHEHLKKCCNAVVPKKRKRHIEQKHMPFAWGSSRYASRRLLYRSKACNAARAISSQLLSKQSGGTIYIDVEPESLMSDDSQPSCSGASQATSFRVTQTMAQHDSSTASDRYMQPSSESPKKHSLILKPGAVFSIPFSYTIPTSSAVPVVSERTVITGNTFGPMLESSESQSSPESAMVGSNGEPVSNIQDTSQQNQSGTKDIIRTSILARKTSRDPVSLGEDDSIPKTFSSKPFQCEKCTMTFNQRIHLKKHMSKHTGIVGRFYYYIICV